MKRRRHTSSMVWISAAVVLMLGWLWGDTTEDARMPELERMTRLDRTPATGERLNLGELAANEQVEVVQIMSRHMRWEARRLLLFGGPFPRAILDYGYPKWVNGSRTPGTLNEHVSGPVKPGHLKALALFLKTARATKNLGERHVYYDTYEITYLRDGRQIGAESLVWDGSHYSDYRDLPAAAQTTVSPEEWENRLPIEHLEIDGYRPQVP